MDRDRIVDPLIEMATEIAAGSDVITFDQLHAPLPPEQLTAEQIGRLLNRLSAKSVQLFED